MRHSARSHRFQQAWHPVMGWICLMLAMTATASAADVTLVQDGKARSAIFVAPEVMADDKPTAGLKFPEAEAEQQRQRLRASVQDLAAYFKKMSGAKVDVVTAPRADGDQRIPILVGELATARFGPPGKSAPYKQGFRVVVSPTGVGLSGESALATSYAIYELLDRLGCRWYMPSELGEVVPHLPTIALAELDFSSAPGTVFRGIWYADDAYRRRNRHGGLLLQAGHALEMYITPDERKQHPEWVGEVGGKPHAHRLKWSSPTLAAAIADKIIARHAQDPQPSYSLSPDDGADWDDSPADKALDAGDYDPTFQRVSVTDRLVVLCNRVAEGVSPKAPNVLFGMLAYVDYTRPPVREKLHPNIVPQLAPISYSRAHPASDDRVPGNKDLRYLIEGWGRKARTTSMYFYAYFLAETSAPNPMLTKWGHDVPYVLANNCGFWQPETLPNFETSMHALYLGCRLAWDPSLKPQAIIDELNARFYGHAAAEMAAYWKDIDDAWVETPEYSGCGFGYLRRFTPERLRQVRALMDRAIAACQTDVERRRVALANDSLRQFELFMHLRQDLAEGRFATLAGDAARWRKQAVELGEKWKDQYAFTRVPWTPHTVSGNYMAAFFQPTYDDASRIAANHQIVTAAPLRKFRYQADADKRGEAAGWAKPDFDDANWKQTDVCLETWSTLGYHDYFKSMWYRRAIDLPALPAVKRVFLWLGSTDGSARVFINGKHVPYRAADGKPSGEVNGYCQPFSWDITEAVRPGESNTLAILCTRTGFNELGTGGFLAPAVIYAEK